MSVRIHIDALYEYRKGVTLRMIEVSQQELARMKENMANVRGMPTYYAVKRDGLKLELELWPEEEVINQEIVE